MKIKSIISLLLFLTLAPIQVSALDYAVDVHAGTLGFGVGGTIKIYDPLNVRFGINSGDFEVVDVDDEDGLNYSDPSFDFDNIYGFADWFPLGGTFRVSAGLILNDNTLSAGAAVDSTGTLVGSTNAPIGTSVNGAIAFDDVATYFGIGWGNPVKKGSLLNFGLDLGLMLQGSPEVSLTVVDPTNTITPADVEQERQDLEDEIDDLDVWPVINFYLSYQF